MYDGLPRPSVSSLGGACRRRSRDNAPAAHFCSAARRLGRYRFFDDFFTGFLAALFFVRVPLDAAAVVDFFFPNAAAQLSE
jgi:hypothetical protein